MLFVSIQDAIYQVVRSLLLQDEVYGLFRMKISGVQER